MRIGLSASRCENRNLSHNLRQIESAMASSRGQVDLLCFSEAFLQGFDALTWNYSVDRDIALPLSSPTMPTLKDWTLRYGMSLATGYIERDNDALYSSCAVLSGGRLVHNYRRVSPGWKESSRTDFHYREGADTGPFTLLGHQITLALCGDLWEYPHRFRTDHLLIWPVYVDFSLSEWNGGELDEYAAQAALASPHTLMVNSIDSASHGGAFHFHNGRTAARLPFDQEGILTVTLP